MKKAALLFSLIALLLAGLMAYGYFNLRLSVVQVTATRMPAVEQQAEFDRLSTLLSRQAVRGVVYNQQGFSGEAADYALVQYVLRLKNTGLLPARVLEAQVIPLPGDVLCYSQQEARGQDVNSPIDLAPFAEIRLHVYLLTRRDGPNRRDLEVSYYVWGNPVFIKATGG